MPTTATKFELRPQKGPQEKFLSTNAAIFWLKAQANWSDKPKEMEVSNAANVVVYLPDNGRSASAQTSASSVESSSRRNTAA